MSYNLIFEHLFIVITASVLSITAGMLLGTLCYILPKTKPAIMQVVDLLQTIPSLALLGIIMVFAGAGKITVIIGITLYSLLPIVRNTCLGFEQVDPGVKEAARGMGMGKLYRTVMIELPLAFPTIFTGIRIAIVNAIGTAVFAAFVGGGGLGSIIYRGIRIQNMEMILSGTLALMLIAVLLDIVMGFFERLMRDNRFGIKKIVLPTAMIFAAFVMLLPFGISRADDNELLLYDGTFSEPQIMNYMVKLLVEDKTDIRVTIQDQMSPVNIFSAISSDKNSCDMMLSYDGTLLTTFFHLDPSDVPEGMTIYDFSNQIAQERYNMRMLKKLGFDNTYAIAVPEHIAQKYDLKTVSDLVPVANELVFGAEHEFFTQEGSMKYIPFTKFYGLNFKDAISMDVSLKYTAAENGSFDVTEVYATDGLNRKAKLKVLEDDRNFFPEYNGAFFVREDTFEKFSSVAPNLEEILNLPAGMISNEDMVEMTYRVDVLGETVSRVAYDFLFERGLISERQDIS